MITHNMTISMNFELQLASQISVVHRLTQIILLLIKPQTQTSSLLKKVCSVLQRSIYLKYWQKYRENVAYTWNFWSAFIQSTGTFI